MISERITSSRVQPSALKVVVVLLFLAVVLCSALAPVAAGKRGPVQWVVSGVSASPTSFYIGGGSSTLEYTLNAEATVSAVVSDAGTTVRTLRSAGLQTPGSYSLVWDGTDSEGASLPAGSYSLVVSATMPYGTRQSAASVQLVAPVLGGVSVSPQAIYTGSGSTMLSYTLADTLPGPATVSVWVRDATGATVRTLQQAAFLNAGTYADTWDGKDDSGVSLPAGSYSFVVAATTVAGTEQSAEAVQLVAPALGAVSVTPQAIYAGGSPTTLSYTLAGPATAAVNVLDSDDATLRVLQAATDRVAGSYSVSWDGTDSDGAILSPGSYSLVVTATTAAGAEQNGKAVQLVAPVLGSVGVSPQVIYAGSGSSTLSYTLAQSANVAVSALDADGAEVATIQSSAPQAAGSYSVNWNGTDSDGASLPAGSYSIVVAATTSVGTQLGAGTVELVAPVLGGVAVSPAAIYVGTGSTTLSYTLTGAATTAIAVSDAGGATVRVLQTDTGQAAGSHSVSWNGTDSDGASLPAGSYSLVVTATTVAGAEQSANTVQLVAPALGAVSVSPASFLGGAGASGSTTVDYTLTGPAEVAVSALDADGAEVATIQSSAPQAAGSYSVSWNGTDSDGASLPAGSYSLVVAATTVAGSERGEQTVQFTPTPLASQASLAPDGTGGYVLHTVIENWSETLNGQTSANYYYDGKAQPWEYAATSGATLTLYVGANSVDQEDTTAGGSVAGTSDARGVTDLAFPSGLAWYDAGGTPLPLFYSAKLTYGGSSRWYPATGRYQLRPPVGPDGHLQFAFMSDIQSASPGSPSPSLTPSGLTSATGPYSAIPDLSRSLGWSTVLAGLRQESGANLVVFGGDAVERGNQTAAPDDGGTQWRTLFDNQQGFGSSNEWSLSSLANTVPVSIGPGNHDDLDLTSGGTIPLAARWAHRPALPTPNTGRGYYAFDQGDVHFIVINPYLKTTSTTYGGWIGLQSPTITGSRTATVGDTTSTYANSNQAKWLIAALDTVKPWTVVVSHTPVFDALTSQPWADANQTGGATSTNAVYYGERDRLLALFAAKGVDVVLQGHLHMFRHHVEKVHSADGIADSAMTFIDDGLAGGPPVARVNSFNGPWIDWVDLNGNGVPDVDEPVATAANSSHWDAGAFGKQVSPSGASGYTGTSDMFHAVGEYNDGLTFSYTMFQTGTDAQGAPTLSMTVKAISWNGATNAWNPWNVYESGQIQQVAPGMVADRLSAN